MNEEKKNYENNKLFENADKNKELESENNDSQTYAS